MLSWKYKKPTFGGQEDDWIGPRDSHYHTVYRMQSSSVENAWYVTKDGTELEEHSEFSVRIHDPNFRSLSFIYKTIAILPKSRLLSIYNLIGEYLKRKGVLKDAD
jgi:hypothetical protein